MHLQSRLRMVALIVSLTLSGAVYAQATATADEAEQKRAADKANRVLAAIEVEDSAKADRVKAILGDWCLTMWSWHRDNNTKLNELWAKWSQARSVVPKDEFPAEVIAHQIDDVYASLKLAYQSFVEQLSSELTVEQVDAIKESWSKSPGMKRTYNAYLQIVPDLNDEQKHVIHAHMFRAREDAMLTDDDREIVSIFKRHKVKVEAYVGTLEWAKLHRAFAEKSKAKLAK